MANLCKKCGAAGFGLFTVDGVDHQDPLCAAAAMSGRDSTRGLSACRRCGTVGEHGGLCDRCR